MAVWNGGDLINNGFIGGNDFGISVSGDATIGGQLINNGTITGSITEPGPSATAIFVQNDAGFNVINNGLLEGDVVLGIGNDIFTGNDGVVTGTIFGNRGDDTIIAGSNGASIEGGQGNDISFGGAGNDVFIFRENSGADSIGGFIDGQDQLDVSALFDDAEEAIAAASQTALGTVIDLGGDTTNTVTLFGINVEQLDATDFLFA